MKAALQTLILWGGGAGIGILVLWLIAGQVTGSRFGSIQTAGVGPYANAAAAAGTTASVPSVAVVASAQNSSAPQRESGSSSVTVENSTAPQRLVAASAAVTVQNTSAPRQSAASAITIRNTTAPRPAVGSQVVTAAATTAPQRSAGTSSATDVQGAISSASTVTVSAAVAPAAQATAATATTAATRPPFDQVYAAAEHPAASDLIARPAAYNGHRIGLTGTVDAFIQQPGHFLCQLRLDDGNAKNAQLVSVDFAGSPPGVFQHSTIHVVGVVVGTARLPNGDNGNADFPAMRAERIAVGESFDEGS